MTDQRGVDNKRTQARSQNREEKGTKAPRARGISLLTVALLLLNHCLFVIHEHHKDTDITFYHLGTVVLAPALAIVCLYCWQYIILSLLYCCTYCKSLWM